MINPLTYKKIYLLILLIVLVSFFWIGTTVKIDFISHHSQNTNYNKQLDLATEIISNLVGYRMNQEHLLDMHIEEQKSSPMKNNNLDVNFYARKAEYLNKKNHYRENLYKNFELANLYFSPKFLKTIRDFKVWNTAYVKKSNYTAEDDKEFDAWLSNIIHALKYEIEPNIHNQ